MSNCRCHDLNNNSSCFCNMCGIGFMLAVFFGLALGVAGFLGLISIGLAALIALIFALIALVTILFVTLFDNTPLKRNCLCENLCRLLIGIGGTIIASAIILLFGIVLSDIAAAILLGLAGIFFALIIVALICLIICLANCDN